MTGRSFQFWGSSSITGNRNNIVFLLLLCSCVYKPSHFGQTTALFQSSTTHNVSLFFDTIYKKIPIAISTPFTSTLEISDNLRPDEKSALQKKKEIWEKYPLPQHWQPPALSNPLGNLKSIVFKCLSLRVRTNKFRVPLGFHKTRGRRRRKHMDRGATSIQQAVQ